MRQRWKQRWIRFAITYENRPLNELNIPKGKWGHSTRLFELEVVFEWHRKPSEFGICDPDFDLTLMAAYIVAKRKMEAYEVKMARKEADRERRNSQTSRHYKRHR